jgi:hypothetical protein
MTSKKCNGPCGEEKDLEEFGINKIGKYGRRNICKKCLNGRSRDEWKEKVTREMPEDVQKGKKKCSGCKKKVKKKYFEIDKTNDDFLRKHCINCETKMREDIKERKCDSCKETKDLSEFTKNQTAMIGYSNVCKICSNKYQKEIRDKLAERNVPDDVFEGTKWCPGCRRDLEKYYFTLDKHRPDFFASICQGCKFKNSKDGVEKRRERDIPIDIYDGTKTCTGCNKLCEKKEFGIKSSREDFLDSQCKVCKKKSRDEIREYIQEKKRQMGGKCVACDESNLITLQFDHYKGDKFKDITMLTSKGSIDQETKKCQLLCAFCHMMKSQLERCKKAKGKKSTRGKRVKANYEYMNSVKLQLGKCNICERKLDPTNPIELPAFHFDHLKQETKILSVSEMCTRYNLDDVKTEIAKCQLACANCHMIRTAEQLNWYSYKKNKKIEKDDKVIADNPNKGKDEMKDKQNKTVKKKSLIV